MPSDRPQYIFTRPQQFLDAFDFDKWDNTLERIFGTEDEPTNFPADATDSQAKFQAAFDELQELDTVEIERLRTSFHEDAIAELEVHLQEVVDYINKSYDSYMVAMKEMISPSEEGRAKLSELSDRLLDDATLYGALETLFAELLGADDRATHFGFLTEASRISQATSNDFLVHFLKMQVYTQKYLAVQLRALFVLMAMNRDHGLEYETSKNDIEKAKKYMKAQWSRVRRDMSSPVFDLAATILRDPTNRTRVFIRSNYSYTWLDDKRKEVTFDGMPENPNPSPWYLEFNDASNQWDAIALDRKNTFNIVSSRGEKILSRGTTPLELGSDERGRWRLKGRRGGTFYLFWVATSEIARRFDGWQALGNVDREFLHGASHEPAQFLLWSYNEEGHNNLLDFLIYLDLPY